MLLIINVLFIIVVSFQSAQKNAVLPSCAPVSDFHCSVSLSPLVRFSLL